MYKCLCRISYSTLVGQYQKTNKLLLYLLDTWSRLLTPLLLFLPFLGILVAEMLYVSQCEKAMLLMEIFYMYLSLMLEFKI